MACMPRYTPEDESFMLNQTQSTGLTAVETALDNEEPSKRIYTACGGYGGLQVAIPGQAITASVLKKENSKNF